VLIAGTLAISTLAAACNPSSGSDSSADELAEAEVATRYGYDASTATVSPVYALVPEYRDPNDGYARDLLAEQCLAGVVEYRAILPGSSPNTSLLEERTGQSAFNEQIATQWGYPHLRPPSTVDSAAPDNVEITPAMSEAMTRCGEQADQRLGVAPERLLIAIEAAGWDAVATNSEVQRVIEGWRNCMAPAGIIDLPDGPNDMPPTSVVPSADGVETVETNVGTPLSDREREVAVFDARCRAEVGFDRAVLRARADAELAVIGRDLKSFEASRKSYQDYAKGIDEVITELG